MNQERPEIAATGTATYCPEDDKLRLYVGRVSREEYEYLRSEGWTATPKQECNFVATWSIRREETALLYSGGILEDEDTGPADRASDRAERFTGYQEKRTDEALQLAEKYEDGPKLIGHQSEALAERKASALDRVGSRAVNAWDKAEYWQFRTQRVIAHALHKAAPGVRMGRIKTLEAEVRRVVASYTPQDDKRFIDDGKEYCICGQVRDRHAVKVERLESIKAAYARYLNHLNLRIAYENQMLEAQGGRAGAVEMVPGGWIGEKQIIKVNKSTVTGRVVSVALKVPKVAGFAYKTLNVPGTDYAVLTLDVERLGKEIYREPTQEELETFEAAKNAEKKQRAETSPKATPLINPTDEDAEKLQEIWNKQKMSYEPKSVMRMTQEEYTAATKSYHKPETKEISGGGYPASTHYNAVNFPAVAKVRAYYWSVIVLTDKPRKAMTPEMWKDPRPELVEEISERIEEVNELSRKILYGGLSEEQKELWKSARLAGLAYEKSLSQTGLTKLGAEILESRKGLQS